MKLSFRESLSSLCPYLVKTWHKKNPVNDCNVCECSEKDLSEELKAGNGKSLEFLIDGL